MSEKPAGWWREKPPLAGCVAVWFEVPDKPVRGSEEWAADYAETCVRAVNGEAALRSENESLRADVEMLYAELCAARPSFAIGRNHVTDAVKRARAALGEKP